MTKEEHNDERVDMLIDVHVPLDQQPNQASHEFSYDFLKVYYGKLFPYSDIFRWMSYGNDGKHPACDASYFSRREFSFTLENDVYLRFQSFKSEFELENSIKEKCPHKIDIGPVYSVDPSKRHAYAQAGNNVFTPVERELIFDIDITEYDDVRYCCSGSDICLNCWPLMAIAIKVIDTALRDDFGFNQILWVYSGRRGVHCWVCDGRARRLSNEVRSSIADYFHVYKGGENSLKKASLTGLALHPLLARAYTDVLLDYFERKLIHNQRLFSLEERYQKILDIISDKSVASEIHEKWQGNKRSSVSEEVRWDQLKSVLQSTKHKGLRRCVEEIVFTYTFPRIDMEVSKHMNHLLKAPFCVHPKTGRVCVPIDPKYCEDFDPTSVPTLSMLIEELNAGGARMVVENEWEGTSLDQSIRFFRSSFLQPLMKSCKDEMESSYNAKIQQSNKSSLSW
ncbi:DNA primase small subunit isoform X2 [Phalaenopsis equestris]|uniref:DNA primase small subunit isoform X2 n=1 Tax=Phalaenopsis equestris TaxID=78828 RepID=UPI0009E22D8E|nr:DNA primase small subunit isoform X2 [Phalaenopsis equestris]